MEAVILLLACFWRIDAGSTMACTADLFLQAAFQKRRHFARVYRHSRGAWPRILSTLDTPATPDNFNFGAKRDHCPWLPVLYRNRLVRLIDFMLSDTHDSNSRATIHAPQCSIPPPSSVKSPQAPTP